MAEITKWGANNTAQHINHDLRELPPGKSYGNESVDTSLSYLNYSLVDRGKTAKEVNKYRRNLEKEIFHYNRKDLVHAVEVVIQLPDDCPLEQEKDFFQESFNYVVSTLPMGERCVIVAEVHKDEHKYVNGVDISKPHLHLMYVPGVPDKKHDGYDYKLCADALTKRAALKRFHPDLQSHLDSKGIKATVLQKKESDGKTIALSVKQLKEITEKTGIVFKKSITIDQLADILTEHQNIEIKDKALQQQLQNYEAKIAALSATVTTQDKTIQDLKSGVKHRDAEIEELRMQVRSKDNEISHSKTTDIESEIERADLKTQLAQKDAENQQLLQKAKQIIAEKNAQIESVESAYHQLQAQTQNVNIYAQQNETLRQQNMTLSRELEEAKSRIASLEKSQEQQVSAQTERDQSWGTNNAWGNTKTWGDNTHTLTEEKLW